MDLIVQEVEDEVLVYDEFNGWAHCLNPELARIWRACDGKTSVHAIATELELDVDVVTAALAELDEQALLQPGYTPPTALSNGNGDGTTRREFGVKAAKVGGAVAAGPAIYSI